MNDPSPPLARCLRPKDVANYFGVDAGKVAVWIRTGKLRAVNVGNGSQRPRYRITASDLAAFEQERMIIPLAKPVRRRSKSGYQYTYF